MQQNEPTRYVLPDGEGNDFEFVERLRYESHVRVRHTSSLSQSEQTMTKQKKSISSFTNLTNTVMETTTSTSYRSMKMIQRLGMKSKKSLTRSKIS